MDKMRHLVLGMVLASGLTACSGTTKLTGTYEKMGSDQTVTFAASGHAVTSGGDTVGYTIGDGQIMITSAWGGAIGRVEGDNLVFPEARSSNVVASSFAGEWVKREY